MKYNPQIHHRQSIRLKGYDYSQAGAYFITICTKNRLHHFGEVQNGEMILSEFGKIALEQWNELPNRFTHIELDAFVVMPNHIHGIIVIKDLKNIKSVGAPLAGAHPQSNLQNPPIGDIVGAYKSLCVHHSLKWIKSNDPQFHLGTLWQRNYWEHIVRHEVAMIKIQHYIWNNPAKWEKDCFIKNSNIDLAENIEEWTDIQ
jgi:putative transposase